MSTACRLVLDHILVQEEEAVTMEMMVEARDHDLMVYLHLYPHQVTIWMWIHSNGSADKLVKLLLSKITETAQ